MQKISLYRYGALILGITLFLLGPAQISPTQKFTPDGNLSHTRAAHRAEHALAKRLDGPMSGTPSGPNNTPNWSGFLVFGTQICGTCTITHVEGTWTVPVVHFVHYPKSNLPCNNHPADLCNGSATWIGIGGLPGDATLIQLGTEQDIDTTGTRDYYAWLQMVPAPSQILANCTAINTNIEISCTVSPGDMIFASLLCSSCITSDQPPQVFSLVMTNYTEGWTWSATPTYSSSLLTGEWIHEMPCIANCNTNTPVYAPLAGYNSVEFSDATVNGGLPSGGLSLNANGIILKYPALKDGVISVPLPVTNNGNSSADLTVQYAPWTTTGDFNGGPYSDIAWMQSAQVAARSPEAESNPSTKQDSPQSTGNTVAMWLMDPGTFVIQPAGHAAETMAALTSKSFKSLDAALAAVEEHTRGVCRHAS